MRYLLWLSLFIFCGVQPAHAATKHFTLHVGGHDRTYRLHVPSRHNPQTLSPLVVVLHGGGGSGRMMERLGFSDLADREDFLVAYPDGIGHNWNDGRQDVHAQAFKENVDDVGFILAMLDDVQRRYRVDRRRVYATGPSNGGFMSSRLGIECSQRFAAVAPVIASIPVSLSQKRPSRPISVLIMQGTSDPLVPYKGGAVSVFGEGRGTCMAAESAVQFWVAADGCDPQGQVTELPHLDPKDGCRVRRTVYRSGHDGTEVAFYRIDGGGHTWPGGGQYLPRRVVGEVCRDIDATQIIWDFFKSHPRR